MTTADYRNGYRPMVETRLAHVRRPLIAAIVNGLVLGDDPPVNGVYSVSPRH